MRRKRITCDGGRSGIWAGGAISFIGCEALSKISKEKKLFSYSTLTDAPQSESDILQLIYGVQSNDTISPLINGKVTGQDFDFGAGQVTRLSGHI